MDTVKVGSLFLTLTPGLGSKDLLFKLGEKNSVGDFGNLAIEYSFQEQSLFIFRTSPNSRLGNTKQGQTNCAGI
jgi:hypothetical protein